MSDNHPDDDVETPPRHRSRTPLRNRDCLLVIHEDDQDLSATQQRRLDSLRRQAERSGDVVVVASKHLDAKADLNAANGGKDVFAGNPSLAADLRRLGVKRITVVGTNGERVAAACQAGRRGGFTVDLASLNTTSQPDYFGDSDHFDPDDYDDDDQSEHDQSEHEQLQDDAQRASGPAEPPTRLSSTGAAEDNELLPGAAGGAPVGAQASEPLDDGRTDTIEWDDTWALRGDAQPTVGSGETGVRGWISKKLHEARDNQSRRRS